MTDGCRVSFDELEYDRLSDYSRATKMLSAVDDIMGGSDPVLLMDCVANSGKVESAIMELAAIDCTSPIDQMTLREVRMLANWARELNAAMAAEIRSELEN